MNEKYLWPLIGVVLGWFLTSITNTLKDHEAKQRRIGRLLSKLILIRDQLVLLISTTNNFKDHIKNPEKYEHLRAGISERHFLQSEESISSLREAIDELSGDYPLYATEFQRLIDTLLKCKKASFEAIAKNKDAYIRTVSLHEVTLDLCDKQLIKTIKRLAWMHSPATYARILFMLLMQKNRAKKHQGMFSRLFNIVFDRSEKTQYAIDQTNNDT